VLVVGRNPQVDVRGLAVFEVHGNFDRRQSIVKVRQFLQFLFDLGLRLIAQMPMTRGNLDLHRVNSFSSLPVRNTRALKNFLHPYGCGIFGMRDIRKWGVKQLILAILPGRDKRNAPPELSAP
jgi:hypothetical protein